ncbi:hypothetical protein AB7M49_004081 [Bradyrhizobium elkanii]
MGSLSDSCRDKALAVRLRLYFYNLAYLDLSDLEASEYNDGLAGERTWYFLIRRNIADGGVAFFSAWSLKAMSMQKLVSSSALIITKLALGMTGIAMSHSSCLPSP